MKALDSRTVAEVAPEFSPEERGFLAVAINAAPGEQRPWAEAETVGFFVARFALECVRRLVAEVTAEPNGRPLTPEGERLAAELIRKLELLR